MKKIILLPLFILFLISCSTDNDLYSTNICTISIIAGETAIIDCEESSFAEGDTVFDVLSNVAQKNRLQFDYDGTGITAYVKGIDNLYAFDKGAESGWVFTVNDEYVNVGCGQLKVKEGDHIEWKYVTEIVGELAGEA